MDRTNVHCGEEVRRLQFNASEITGKSDPLVDPWVEMITELNSWRSRAQSVRAPGAPSRPVRAPAIIKRRRDEPVSYLHVKSASHRCENLTRIGTRSSRRRQSWTGRMPFQSRWTMSRRQRRNGFRLVAYSLERRGSPSPGHEPRVIESYASASSARCSSTRWASSILSARSSSPSTPTITPSLNMARNAGSA